MATNKYPDDFFESLITDDILNLIRNGERDLDVEKFLAFKAILAELRNAFDDNCNVDVKAALFDQFNPRSGWITICGKNVSLKCMSKFKKEMQKISNIGVMLDNNGNIMISLMFYSVITISGGKQ